MAAFNEGQVTQQIRNAINLANLIAKTQVAIYQWKEAEEVTTQNWNQLPTDFPALVDGVTNDDPILLDGFQQNFSSQQLNQFDTAVGLIADALDGVDITVTTNLGRNIRRLTQGVV